MSIAASIVHRQRKGRWPLIAPVAVVLLTIALLVPSTQASLAIAPPVGHAGNVAMLSIRANVQMALQPLGLRNASSHCPCNSGLPGGSESAALVEASSQWRLPASQCPCNLGLPGGPRLSIPALVAQVATAQPSTQHDLTTAETARLAGSTEAAGYRAISKYLVERYGRVGPSPARTAQLGARTEAKGFTAIELGRSASAVPSLSGGFNWGDAGIGAARTAGGALLAGVGILLVARRGRERSLRSAVRL
jgi:hypothetical protein